MIEALQKLPAILIARRVFECAAIAAFEIDEAKKRYRGAKRRKAIDDAFPLLMPGKLAHYAYAIYRAHAREILDRIARRKDVKPATKAEVMVSLSEMSLIAPLSQQYGALYEELFRDVFGHYIDDDEEHRIREPWPDASRELFVTLTRRYATARAA